MIKVVEFHEVSTIEDPFTRSVTLLFMLVKEHGLDPWSLDMKHLIMEYQKYALKDDDLDLPLAGSVLGWAWDVLKMRANGAIDATEPIPEPQPDWVDFDFGWEPTYAEQLEDSIEPPSDDPVFTFWLHKGTYATSFLREIMKSSDVTVY